MPNKRREVNRARQAHSTVEQNKTKILTKHLKKQDNLGLFMFCSMFDDRVKSRKSYSRASPCQELTFRHDPQIF
jgi:hypothetical protein